MKTVLFISSNKMLGQGLSEAIRSKPELDFLWAAQLNYPQAAVGVDIFHADVVILDIVDQADMSFTTVPSVIFWRSWRPFSESPVPPRTAVFSQKHIELAGYNVYNVFSSYAQKR